MVQLNFYSNVTLLAVYLSLNFSYVQHKLNMKFSFLFLFYDIHMRGSTIEGSRGPDPLENLTFLKMILTLQR